MQQPALFQPSASLQAAGPTANYSQESAEPADLDLGYEGAFPFLTEDHVSEAGRLS